MLWIPERDVRRAVEPDRLIAAIAEAFIALARGEIVNPPQTRIDDAARASNYVAFPAYLPGRNAYAVKVLGANERNPARGLPFIHALNVLLDAEEARPVAIIESGYLTGCRTAATSAVALRALGGDGGTLGVLGTGLQARLHLEFLPRVRRFDRLLVCSPSGAHERAAALAASLGAAPATSVDELVAASDVLVTATNAARPLFAAAQLRDGARVLVVGKFRPGATEVPVELTERVATLLIDQPARFLAHWRRGAASDLSPAALARIAVLGELLAAPPSHPAARCPCLFISEGMAMEDAVASLLVHERALELGLGTHLA
jgi:ornithine cyclodeaminase/alanine dehydrogenase-like protein (mu-crystallin family)